MTRTETIRKLNDAFRFALAGGHVVVTKGVSELPNIGRLLNEVRYYAAFTEDDDPHGEHDFGSILFDGQTYFWKIDYYNLTMDGGSIDPANPTVTTRTISIMRSDEY